MNYYEAIEKQDQGKWHDAVDDDQDVFETVTREDVPSGANIMTSGWAMKKASNGTSEQG